MESKRRNCFPWKRWEDVLAADAKEMLGSQGWAADRLSWNARVQEADSRFRTVVPQENDDDDEIIKQFYKNV